MLTEGLNSRNQRLREQRISSRRCVFVVVVVVVVVVVIVNNRCPLAASAFWGVSVASLTLVAACSRLPCAVSGTLGDSRPLFRPMARFPSTCAEVVQELTQNSSRINLTPLSRECCNLCGAQHLDDQEDGSWNALEAGQECGVKRRGWCGIRRCRWSRGLRRYWCCFVIDVSLQLRELGPKARSGNELLVGEPLVECQTAAALTTVTITLMCCPCATWSRSKKRTKSAS